MGFGGRAAIHPAQVGVINDVFTPSPREVAAAREVIASFEAAGGGASVDDEGRMVDEAVVRAARRTLSIAGH
jgi:citrate lyase subunit beta/citryl-CoA lyase